MPEQHDPSWPSADEDSTSGERRAVEGQGGATARLPLPQAGSGRTEELAVPNVTPDEPGSWFVPGASPATPPPGRTEFQRESPQDPSRGDLPGQLPRRADRSGPGQPWQNRSTQEPSRADQPESLFSPSEDRSRQDPRRSDGPGATWPPPAASPPEQPRADLPGQGWPPPVPDRSHQEPSRADRSGGPPTPPDLPALDQSALDQWRLDRSAQEADRTPQSRAPQGSGQREQAQKPGQQLGGQPIQDRQDEQSSQSWAQPDQGHQERESESWGQSGRSLPGQDQRSQSARSDEGRQEQQGQVPHSWTQPDQGQEQSQQSRASQRPEGQPPQSWAQPSQDQQRQAPQDRSQESPGQRSPGGQNQPGWSAWDGPGVQPDAAAFAPDEHQSAGPDDSEAPTQWSAWQRRTGGSLGGAAPENRQDAEDRDRPEPPEQPGENQRAIIGGGARNRPDWDQFDQRSQDQRSQDQRVQDQEGQDPVRRPESGGRAGQEPSRRPDFRDPQARPPVPQAGQHVQPMRIEPGGEQRAAEATVGIERPDWAGRAELQDGDDHDPPSRETGTETPTGAEAEPRPRRKRRGLLVGVFALLVVVALGVAAAMPNVSNRLSLPWAPNAPKGDSPQPAAVVRVLRTPDMAGQAPTASGVTKALSGPAASSALGTLTGSVIDASTGDVLWSKDPTRPLTPASTTKLLTVAAALLSVDQGLQLSTKIVAGAQDGTVVLVGGGDVTLTNEPLGKDSPLYPGAAHVDDLVAQVKKAVGGNVKKVQLDTSLYKGQVTAPGWDPTDAPSTFAAQVAPVMADGGRSKPEEDHAMRVPNPASNLATQIAQKLGAQFQSGGVTAPKDAKVLGEVKSPPLTEMANSLLQLSDNVSADAMARQTALANGAEPSFAGGAAATKDVLAKNRFDMSGVQLFDNSGLSKQNKVPAKLLSDILAVAAAPDGKDNRTAKLRPLLAGLPVAGGSGTLAERYGDEGSKGGKGWIRAKTGTLSGVNTLGGVLLDADGRVLVFALMSQTSLTTDPDPVRAALDAVATALRGCGCH
ncbi:D-alanyl-D-alanine carboxypeptidase/D-alanyl-D-alanine endopeptidase [Amycolatopsis sp. H20-H5]|uniref:D-alanyl-D-alanine carboxypeptidase/D-alanyl-D-alanine endopeptidase n=1 Tax=Amycolatopsis sp. H20-H5 TaxID=3046309 RepID=UPI002DBEC4A2|nr:D-alanyl-D-alanine carboxypeptidase/D-alanyl-D-alanine-endopeptidase [Amycolatopsis sp. H20-H5]MEC3981453.1 D-alanyl-D-alanine carboxypeptidase/D-alanyl-D-alanine-endopeptidase [Amycolatopsis sp. H20-H5]